MKSGFLWLMVSLVIVVGFVIVAYLWSTGLDSLPVALAAIGAFGAWLTALQMRFDSIERARPFVVVDLDLTHTQLIYFRIRNLGSGIARRVYLTFDPVPIDWKGRKLTDTRIFQRPIPVMAPSEQIRQLLAVATKIEEAEIPKTFEVRVTYQGEGKLFGYSDTFCMDLEQCLGMTAPPKTVEEHLADLVKKVGALSA